MKAARLRCSAERSHVAGWALDLVDLLVSLIDEKLTRVKRTYQVRCSHELSNFRFSPAARRPSCQSALRRGIVVVEVEYRQLQGRRR